MCYGSHRNDGILDNCWLRLSRYMRATDNYLEEKKQHSVGIAFVKSENKLILRTVVLGVALTLSTNGFAQEQFSLEGQPGVQFDGESDIPTTGTLNGIKYVVINGHAVAQGDMVLGKVFADGRLKPITKPTTRGLGQNNLVDRWPDGVVPYQFDETITDLSKQRSLDAIQHWTSRSGIKFVERTAANEALYPDFVNFEPSAGCASWVGRIGQQQAVWVSDNCTTGSIIHEIGHAIGLFHEHTRPDRDNFISVNWDNIVNGKSFNFDVLNAGIEQLGPYDYGSIMHYGEFFFSDNGSMTIEAPDNVSIGQRNALSAGDAASVNTMYQTDLSLTTNVSTTDNGVEVGIDVTNLGIMGANNLQLITTFGDDADWISISTNSGWECQAFGAELRCTRDTLTEQTQTQFTVLVEPNGAEAGEFSARLISNTRDSDNSNNTVNFDGALEVEVPPSAPAAELNENSTTGESSEGQAPELGAAKDGAASGGSSGGGAALWIALFAWLTRRQRNKA